MNFFCGFRVKQIDTHVKGTLTECQIDDCGRITRERVLKEYIVFPKEIFLYWVVRDVIAKEAIKKREDFSHFENFFNSLRNPSRLKIAGEYKSNILKYRKIYELVLAVLAVDDEFGRVDISTRGAWHYSFGQIVIRKKLIERIIKILNPDVIFPTIWTDIEFKINKIIQKIQFSDIASAYKDDIKNAFEIILQSPVTVLFSNVLKMLAPTFEGILKRYISRQHIKGIKLNNLSTIIGCIAKYNGPEFSNEIKEYLKIVLEPIRNLSLHGGVPSESVCKFYIVIMLEVLEELLDKEKA